MIVEVPPEAQVHQTKQYKMLSEDDKWTSIKIDGCTHGQRMVVPGPSGILTVGYCKVEWEYFASNVTIRPKSSDKCSANHSHVCQQTMHDHADKGCRTSQISRRLLNALKFQAPSDGRLVSMPASIPKGRIDRVVVSWMMRATALPSLREQRDVLGSNAGSHCAPVLRKMSSSRSLRKPAGATLYVASLLRLGERPEEVEG